MYNIAVGLLTLVPAILLWVNNRFALTASIMAFGVHTVVLVLLITVFCGQVTTQSISAMSFRVIVWIVILALLFFRSRKA